MNDDAQRALPQALLQELLRSGASVAELTARARALARRPRRARKRLTLAAALDQAHKAGHTVARYEEEPDGKIVVLTGGKPGETNTAEVNPNNPWDEVLDHAADKERTS